MGREATITLPDEIDDIKDEEIIEALIVGCRYMLVWLQVPGCKEVKVSRCKVKQITEMMEVAVNMPNIKQIYLFGSCISSLCREKSDIDFYVVVTDDDSREVSFKRSNMLYEKSITCDWLEYDWVEEKESKFKDKLERGVGLMKLFKKEAVLLYERNL